MATKKVIEKKTGEKYTSKGAKAKHERTESKAEMEKEYGSNKGPKTFRCDECGEIYFTLPDQVNASCPHCVKGRWLTQIEDTSLQ